MKKLKKFFLCLVLVITLGLTFTACGEKTDDDKPSPPPEEEEVYETVKLSFQEYEEFISGLGEFSINGFKVAHETKYADGTTDTATQVVNIDGDVISSSIEVTGETSFKGYLSGENVYYDSDETKRYHSKDNLLDQCPDYNTAAAYRYLNFVINPVSQSLNDCYIYDGSLFLKLKEVFSSREESYSFEKKFSDKHTNISINFEDSYLEASFTLYFTGTKLTGLDIWIKFSDFERTSKLQESNEKVEFPSFEDYRAENSEEKDDDVWKPNS